MSKRNAGGGGTGIVLTTAARHAMTDAASTLADANGASCAVERHRLPATIAGSVQDQPQVIFGIDRTTSPSGGYEESLSPLVPVAKHVLLGLICALSFAIRLFSVVRYESVIHEYDPYFNFRATKVLASDGFLAFLNWFDDRPWYPVGRVVGGTVYPGLMSTASIIQWTLTDVFRIPINIRNTCVFIAPVFAAATTVSTYLLTKEVTLRASTSLLAAALVAVVPAYISRSVGGSFDNEAISIFALVFTFYLWVKAVRTGSMLHAGLCALAYAYMVAAWGGYVLIINLIPLHVVLLVLAGRYSPRLYVAYVTFYSLGTLLAMQVPFVGFNMLQQAECAASHGVFVLLHVYVVAALVQTNLSPAAFQKCVWYALSGSCVALAGVGGGYAIFKHHSLAVWWRHLEWSGRSLSLLDPTSAFAHMPIVASVSEHQPPAWTSFFFDLHILVLFAPLGLFFLFQNLTDGGLFVLVYGTVAWYFAGVMVRLMLVLAPVASVLAAVGLSTTLRKFLGHLHRALDVDDAASADVPPVSEADGPPSAPPPVVQDISSAFCMLVVMLSTLLLLSYQFHAAHVTSMAYSSPSIVVDGGRDLNNRRRLLDDFREAYSWLRHNSASDAKVLAWWDYGYQLSAMANRTVLVDNNTWNNTHIATVGRVLAGSEAAARPILMSLDVSYVLVVFGGVANYASDDMNKFLWPVRIGHGVFPDAVPPEEAFTAPASGGDTSPGLDIGPTGSTIFHDSVAFKLSYLDFAKVHTEAGQRHGYDRVRKTNIASTPIQLTQFEEAFTSEHWIVRIFKVKPVDNAAPPDAVVAPPTADSPSDAKRREHAKSIQASTTSDHHTTGLLTSSGEDVEGTPRFLGCVTGETMLGHDRVYSGGRAGANIAVALQHAKTHQKRFLAIARVGMEGHAFAFESLTMPESKFNGNDAGCSRPCADASTFVCGCADQGCVDAHVHPGPGQEHNRRWAVYERTRA